MPFAFKLHDPPCDVAFLSIVDGEALYNADNARTRDVKEATIRQIGWHRVALPQDWFLSEKALQTTSRVLEAMQCTVQYLKYRGKNEEKRSLKATAALQHCEEERAAAFEELIELRETVALYKKKLRDLSQGPRGRATAAVGRASRMPSPAVRPDGLQCAFCENVYPSRHALESHFRKRHKRSSGYAAMAAASAAVSQQQDLQEQQQQQQEQEQRQPLAVAALPQRNPPNLPFLDNSPPLQPAPPVTPTATAEERRGDRALREELSELRLTVAKLLTQQAEFYRGMLPSSMAAVPTASVPAVTRASPTTTSTTQGASATAGSLPGLVAAASASGDENASVVLRIPRELLQTSAELQLLQAALQRGKGSAVDRSADNGDRPQRGQKTSPPPRNLTPRGTTRPTLDPKSFLRSSASGSVNSGAGGAEAQRASTLDSLVEVSPMSPSPPVAHHGSRNEAEASSQLPDGAGAALSGWGMLGQTAASSNKRDGVPSASIETQGPARKGAKPTEHSLHSSAHALTVPSELGSVRTDDNLTASSHDYQPHPHLRHTPLAGGLHNVTRASADSGQLLAHGPDSDSPMVRLPSSTDATSHASSSAAPPSPSANRYGAALDSEEASQVTSNGPSGGVSEGNGATTLLHAREVQPAPGAYLPAAAPSAALRQQVAATAALLQKKSYGPVPTVPILRSPSSDDSIIPPPRVPPSNPTSHPAAHDSQGVAREKEEDVADVAGAQRGGSPDPSTTLRPGGARSPTQTPRRGSTPPTSRVAAKAQVPTLNLSSVSPHASADVPQRSASPFVGRSHTHHSGGTTVEGHRGSSSAVVDAVVHGSMNSASAVLQSSFTPATQAPTQKAIPVVRLVPPALSDSAELAVKAHDDDATSAPSFSNTELQARQQQQQQTHVRSSSAHPPNVLQASDASYSVEARPFDDTDEEQQEADEEDDAMSAGLYEMFSGNSSGSLRDDIAVDQQSGGSSPPPLASDGPQPPSDPVMEDVLTDDLVQAAPLFRSPMATYPAPVEQAASDSASEAKEEETSGERLADLVGADGDDAADEMGHPDAGGSAAASEQSDTQEVEEAKEEDSVSGDYSYYSYSYSEEEAERGEEEDTSQREDRNDSASPNFSLGTPGASPPMAASPMAASPTAAMSSPGGDGDRADFTSAAAAGHVEDDRSAVKKTHKKEKRGTTGGAGDATAASAVSGGRGEARTPAGLPRVYSTEVMSGSEEVASIPPQHDTSFQSNVSHTMKKAGTAFKSLFGKKRKK